jgi:hypothetical protein
MLENAHARQQAVRCVSNASLGYDSPAVTALVSDLVPTTCYTAPRSGSHIPRALQPWLGGASSDDDGSPIAVQMGAIAAYLDGDTSTTPGELERWMWATAALSPELVFWPMFKDAERCQSLTLWFNGYNGDGLWDAQLQPRCLDGELWRPSPNGFALAEARIRYGLIDCSVPFLFAREVKQIDAITRSGEMQPWHLGSDYDRPIPRRILEQKGIARDRFGFSKKAVAQHLEAPQGQELRSELFTETDWDEGSERVYLSINLGFHLARRMVEIVKARAARSRLPTVSMMPKNVLERVGLDLRRDTFVYCCNRLADELASIVKAPIEVPERPLVSEPAREEVHA